jgi:GNAT superfamily N-acetyltransferase
MSVHVEALADEVFSAAEAQNRAGARCIRRPYGEIVTHPDYPHVFFLHYIAGLNAPGWDRGRLERVIEEEIPYAGHYRVSSRDATTRDGLGRALEGAGYQAEHKLGMTQLADPELTAMPGISVVQVRNDDDWTRLASLVMVDWAGQGEHAAAEVVGLYRWRAKNLPQRYYLAYQGDQAVGFCGLFQHRTTGYIHALFTLAESRGRGVGTTMVIRSLEEARACGCDRTGLTCLSNSSLSQYYRRLGFRVVGEEFTWMKPR